MTIKTHYVRHKYTAIIITGLLLFSIAFQASAQRRKVRNLPGYDEAPYHFGFILGMNQMLFSIKTEPGFQSIIYDNPLTTPDLNPASSYQLMSVEHTPYMGFTIGIVSNLRLAEYWDLRFVPSLSFGERDINYVIQLNASSGTKTLNEVQKKLQSTFIEFPLNLKFKGARHNNIRPYWLAGVRYSLDLASDSKKNNQTQYVSLNKQDVYSELGAGFDFYTTYFKFGIEAKMSYGMRDILERNSIIYTQGIDKFRSKLFLLSFTFE